MLELSLEDMLNAENLYDGKPSSITEPLDWDLVKEEIAFHEASHFVFQCLLFQLSLGFKPDHKIEYCYKRLNGKVEGFVPASDKAMSSDYELRRWYIQDHKRTIARILSTLAGHASCKYFFRKNDEYFISDPNLEKLTVKFYRIRGFPFSNLSDGSHDIENIKRYLSYIQKADCFEKTTEYFLEEVLFLMREQPIENAIRHVKDEIIKRDCHCIEGEALDRLKKKVLQLTRTVSIESAIVKIKSELQL